MVQEMQKPLRTRLGVGDGIHPKEDMEDGLSNSEISKTSWTHKESQNVDCYISF